MPVDELRKCRIHVGECQLRNDDEQVQTQHVCQDAAQVRLGVIPRQQDRVGGEQFVDQCGGACQGLLLLGRALGLRHRPGDVGLPCQVGQWVAAELAKRDRAVRMCLLPRVLEGVRYGAGNEPSPRRLESMRSK